MEKSSNLFFELSHEDRLRIFNLIQKDPAKLTHLSEKLKLQVQETSRHLTRLSDAKLVSKDVDGFYHLTPYGDHVKKLLPGFEFLTKHKNYLLTHKTSHLPEQFVNRIGELNKSTFTDDIMVAFQEGKELFEEAKEYIWGLTDHMIPSTPPSITNAMKRGVNVKLLFLEDTTFPAGYEPIPFIPNRIERKILDRVDAELWISEKKGLMSLPTVNGPIDNTGFISKDETSLNWLKDLFEYYWKRAKTGTPAISTKEKQNKKGESQS